MADPAENPEELQAELNFRAYNLVRRLQAIERAALRAVMENDPVNQDLALADLEAWLGSAPEVDLVG